jgi:hypothetical protein
MAELVGHDLHTASSYQQITRACRGETGEEGSQEDCLSAPDVYWSDPGLKISCTPISFGHCSECGRLSALNTILKMGPVCFSETSVLIYRVTRRHHINYHSMNPYSRENLWCNTFTLTAGVVCSLAATVSRAVMRVQHEQLPLVLFACQKMRSKHKTVNSLLPVCQHRPNRECSRGMKCSQYSCQCLR